MNSIKPISESNDPLHRRGARRVPSAGRRAGQSNDPLHGRGARKAGWVIRHSRHDPLLKERARQLRKHMTLAEVLLWNQLKNKQMLGYDFDRQRPIGDYIVDFFCKKLNLAIEIDGQSHNFKATQDTERQKQIERMGVRFIRFWDYEVKNDIKSVIERIRDWILKEERTHPGFQPPLHGGDQRRKRNGNLSLRPPLQMRGSKEMPAQSKIGNLKSTDVN